MSDVKHLINSEDFSKEDFVEVVRRMELLEKNPEKYKDVCAGKVLGALFFKESTSTNASTAANASRPAPRGRCRRGRRVSAYLSEGNWDATQNWGASFRASTGRRRASAYSAGASTTMRTTAARESASAKSSSARAVKSLSAKRKVKTTP